MYNWFKSKAPWVCFSDSQIDEEIERAYSIVNPVERAKAMKKLQATVQKAAPWIFLWQNHDIYGVSRRVDWEPRPDQNFYLFEAKIKK